MSSAQEMQCLVEEVEEKTRLTKPPNLGDSMASWTVSLDVAKIWLITW